MTPRLPRSSSGERHPSRNGGTWIALVFIVAFVIGIVALMSQVMPQIGGIFLVVAGLFFFIAFHYFTWGRWLMNHMHQLEDDEVDS